VHAFSRAIANTDAHLGNYGLTIDDDGRSRLAPLYDISPMAFAPRHDEVPPVDVVATRLRAGPIGAPSSSVRALIEALRARVEDDQRISRPLLEAWSSTLPSAHPDCAS
jgi:hypothetical protein